MKSIIFNDQRNIFFYFSFVFSHLMIQCWKLVDHAQHVCFIFYYFYNSIIFNFCFKASPSLICNFEHDSLCGYTIDETTGLKWTRTNTNTNIGQTKPPGDHTFNTIYGYYMYLESNSNTNTGSVARLTSPITDPGESFCLVFYYHMLGS
jgi:hypothetical protein